MAKQKNSAADTAIVNAFLQRDESALSLIEREYGKYIYKIAFNITGSGEDAKECENDTYMRLWQSIPPDRPENFKAYISRLSRNVALDRVKLLSRDKRIPSHLTVALSEIEEFVPDSFGVEAEYEARLLKKAVDGFIRALSKREKYIFICRYYCADSVSDIANALGIGTTTVYRELDEIRKKLKDKLVKEGLWNENGKS